MDEKFENGENVMVENIASKSNERKERKGIIVGIVLAIVVIVVGCFLYVKMTYTASSFLNQNSKKINAFVNEAFEGITFNKDYLENIDVISKRQDALDVEPVDICEVNSTSLKAFQVIGYILLIIKIIVPLILIVLGSIDFAKAALSGDDKSTKDAAVQFGKRVLIGLIIFFIPTIIDFFLSLLKGTSEVVAKYENCTNCILNPNNSGKCSPRGITE